jgi:hypothetical protein
VKQLEVLTNRVNHTEILTLTLPAASEKINEISERAPEGGAVSTRSGRVEKIVSSGQLKLLSRAGPIEFYLPARSPQERQTYLSLLTIGFQ